MRLPWLLRPALLLTALSLAACPADPRADDDTPADDDSAGPTPEEGADEDEDGFCVGTECDDEDDEPGDCDDGSAATNPDADEVCDAEDNDCDARIDENFDQDADGYVTMDNADCVSNYSQFDLDCNDQIATIFPGNPELCDGNDNDCNGQIDDGLDNDHDTHRVCGNPNDDCDDNDPTIHPAAVEVCDQEDNNCDSIVDNGPATDPDFADADHDGVSICSGDCDDAAVTNFPDNQEACDGADNDCDEDEDEEEDIDHDGDGAPGPYPGCTDVDCDDEDASVYPSAPEICDLLDNNCNGVDDENLDFDFDGFTSCEGDCASLNASVNPASFETCDGFDNDCDGTTDEGFDGDGDLQSACAGDCDDNNASIYIGAPELCDQLDNDCNGGLGVDELDQDGDAFSVCGGDCDEGSADIRPGQAESCNAVDDDCAGGVPADELDDDLDGYITCTPGDCTLQFVADADAPSFWSSFSALDALGVDALPWTDAAATGVLEDTSAFGGSRVLLWYTGGREITVAEAAALEAWLADGRSLIVTGPNALSDTVPGGPVGDDDSAAGDDDSAVPGDDDSALPGDDDSAVPGDDDSAIPGDDDSALPGDDDSALAGDDDSAVFFAPPSPGDPPADYSRLASLVRSTTWGDGPQGSFCAVSSAATPLTNGPFGSFGLGTTFTASSSNHELATADSSRGAIRVASIGSRAKILYTQTIDGGRVIFWNGNENLADWSDATQGAMLRNVVTAMNLGCGGALAGGDCDDADPTLYPGSCP